MNDFLKKQLETKLQKFMEQLDDYSLTELVNWLMMGDSVLKGKPDISDEHFDYFRTQILTDDLLVKLIDDLKIPTSSSSRSR